MKKIWNVFTLIVLAGCAETNYRVVHNYKLEKYQNSEVPVCVDYKQTFKIAEYSWVDVDECNNETLVPEKYEPTGRTCDILTKEIVPYSYCLATLPKPVILVKKKKDDMTICYDRNNKVELPILYCQKDMINIQTTNVHTSVTQTQRTSINW